MLIVKLVMVKNILVLSSTFPLTDTDKTPTFVKDQVVSLKKQQPEFNFYVISASNKNYDFESNRHFTQFRYRYFYRKFEKFGADGIIPTLKRNRMYYFILPFYVIAQIFYSLFFVKKNNIDMVYAHWVMPQAITALIIKKVFKIPFVFTSHRSDSEIFLKMPFFGKKLLDSIILNAYKFTTVSEETFSKLCVSTNQLEEAKKKNLILPMGIRDELFDKIISKKPGVFQENQKFKLSFIGRFVQEKGVENFINEIANTPKNLENVEVLLCGSGVLKERYETLIKKCEFENKIFISDDFLKIDELKYIYLNSDFIVIPSFSEGLPLVLLESLYFSKIVIASNKSNAGEVITHGKDGFIYNPSSENDFNRLFSEILSNKYDLDSISKNAHEIGKTFKSINTSNELYEHFFLNK